MKPSLLFLIICSIVFASSGLYSKNDNNYDTRNIPPNLIVDGGAVIRNETKIFEIEDYKNATLEVIYAVTIFNKDQQHYGTVSLWYDKFRTIEELDGKIFDKNGNEIRDLNDDDIKDYSDFESYSLYDDNRVKYVELYYDKFPYTIEFTYTYNYNGYLTWPTWYSRSSLDPVEYSSFKVITPEDYDLRFWCNVDSIKPVIKNISDQKSYSWKEELLPKLSYDAVGEDIEDVATIVHIAPSDFEIDGYKGNMNSWRSFGSWYYNLYKDRVNLPELSIKEIKDRISSVADEKQKIESLYRYMQAKTRYVSVQLGIGGWQPYDADYVYKNGYGDCKALSNYMVSILKIANINAYPVLINNGHHRTPLITEFPSNQFNHAIVCVPLKSDTVWLECTNQVIPPGSIGSSNENRDALMITPEGGVIVKTPSNTCENNLQVKNIFVVLSGSGNAKVNSHLNFYGDQQNQAIIIAEQSTPKEKEKWIKNLFEVPDIVLTNYSFQVLSENKPELELKMDITLLRYGSISGNRMFFNPNLMERSTSVPKDVKKRLSPIRFSYPYLDVDSVHFQIPDNYKVETLPKEINIQSSFGSFYSGTLVKGDNSLLFVRSLKIKNYSVPAEDYSEYQKFISETVKADKQQVVLIKKGS